MGCQVVRATDEPEPAVPCDTCGAESVVIRETYDLTSGEHSTKRMCEAHAVAYSPEEFFLR